MNRAAARRRGKRKEAERKAVRAAEAVAREQQFMWRKLSNTHRAPTIGYRGDSDLDSGSFYCPYVPIIRPGSFTPVDPTA